MPVDRLRRCDTSGCGRPAWAFIDGLAFCQTARCLDYFRQAWEQLAPRLLEDDSEK